MIYITLQFVGCETHAHAEYWDGKETHRWHEQATTGAKAITALVEQLVSAKLTGLPWEVVGGSLRGVVPARKFRKSAKRKKPVQTSWLTA